MISKHSFLFAFAVVIVLGGYHFMTTSASAGETKQTGSIILITEADGTVRSSTQEVTCSDSQCYAQSLIDFGYSPEYARLRAEYIWTSLELAEKDVINERLNALE